MESPVVYYLYNRGSVIYDLNTKDSDIDFLVVVDEEFILPEEFEEFKYEHGRRRKIEYNIKYDNCDFIFFTTNEWFDKVTSGSLVAWECACLPKKFIHKEHVKLLLSTNPIQLRRDFDFSINTGLAASIHYFNIGEFKLWKKDLWKFIKEVKFINQIIQNHKIVNFKEANSEYDTLVNNDCIDHETVRECWDNLIKPHINALNKATDGMLRKELEKKIVQNK